MIENKNNNANAQLTANILHWRTCIRSLLSSLIDRKKEPEGPKKGIARIESGLAKREEQSA